jgi:hypothetical protein
MRILNFFLNRKEKTSSSSIHKELSEEKDLLTGKKNKSNQNNE